MSSPLHLLLYHHLLHLLHHRLHHHHLPIVVQPTVDENNVPVTSDCEALKMLIDNGLDVEKVIYFLSLRVL